MINKPCRFLFHRFFDEREANQFLSPEGIFIRPFFHYSFMAVVERMSVLNVIMLVSNKWYMKGGEDNDVLVYDYLRCFFIKQPLRF